MASEKVKLLGFWVSPFSFRVEWALKLKSFEYEYIEEDIFNKSHLLLELNPVHKKVPAVLIHDQKVILESFVILEYIDETWKQYPLLPQDPYKRAIVRFWTKFTEEKLLENAWMAMCSEGDAKERALKGSIEAIEKIEAELKGKTVFWRGKHWVFGPCTWMDLLLASCLGRSWVHENCRPNPIPKHHCLDEQFSQPPCDQEQVTSQRQDDLKL